MTLQLFTAFHANLDFSSVPEVDLPRVLDRCYWPLLHMAEEESLPLGIEMPARTLERLQREDPEWVKAFAGLAERGLVEAIGSGLAQVVAPLAPADVNRENLRAGCEGYAAALGRAPSTWFVNEQVFSAGLVDLYAEIGARALICEWNNPATHRPELRPLRLASPRLRTSTGAELPILWNDTVLFQRLQRAAHGEIPLESYLTAVRSAGERAAAGVRCAYGGDLEIFDYRPGGPAPAGTRDGREMARVRAAFAALGAAPGVAFELPRAVAEAAPAGPVVELASAPDPIPCKKQPRYNPTRWAVSGRGGLDLNTRCFALRRAQGLLGPGRSREQVRQLVSLWRSDLRTRATEEKWREFQEACGAATLAARVELERSAPALPADADALLWNPHPVPWPGEPVELTLQLAPGRLRWAAVQAEPAGALPTEAAQLEAHGRHRDGSLRRVKLALAPRLEPGQQLLLRLVPGPEPAAAPDWDGLALETAEVRAEFLPHRGGALASLRFPAVAEHALVGTIPHGSFDHIAYTPDFFSGLAVAHTESGEKVTDLVHAEAASRLETGPLRVGARFEVTTPLGRWTTHYRLYRDRARLDLVHELELRGVRLRSLRLGVATFPPGAFERESLEFATVNGGERPERFAIGPGCRIEQARAVSASVTASSCLGATEGWVSVGDGSRGVALVGDRAEAAVVPLLEFAEVDGRPFLRVHHSAAESDETQSAFLRGTLRFPFAIIGHRADLQGVRETAGALERGLVVRSQRGVDVAGFS